MGGLVVIIWCVGMVGNGWLLSLFRWSRLEIGFQRVVSESAQRGFIFAKLRLVGRLEIGISLPTDI